MVIIFISRFSGPTNLKLHETIPHFERLFRCFRWMPMSMPVKPPGLGDPELRVSPRWASQGVESERNMCGKARALSFNVQIFMKSTFSTKDSTHIGMEPLGHDQRCFAAILHTQTSQSGPCCAGGCIMLLCSFQWPRQIAAFLTLSPTKTCEMPYVAGTQIQKT